MGVDGKYQIEMDSPMGRQETILTLKTDGPKLSGNMESPFGAMGFTGGAVQGDAVAWIMEISFPMGKIKFEFKGRVTGNEISGEVKAGDLGTSSFKGKRV